jgi:lipoprotein NlpI
MFKKSYLCFFLLHIISFNNSNTSFADGKQYNNEALLLHKHHKYKEAIRNYSLSISTDDLEPKKLAQVYSSRGNAYLDSGFPSRAIEDFTKAIELDLTYPEPYHNRATIYLCWGHYAQAEKDLHSYLTLLPSDFYMLPWLYIAQARAGKDAQSELKLRISKSTLTEWQNNLVSMLTDKISPAQFLEKIENQDELCKSYFYAAEHYLLKGDKENATSMFNMAGDSKKCAVSMEYTCSKAELPYLK